MTIGHVAKLNLTSQMNVDEFSNLSQHEQANTINAAFLESLEEYRLPVSPSRLLLEESPKTLNVTEIRVLKVFAKLNPGKASRRLTSLEQSQNPPLRWR